jgi:hypothetical protein
MAASMVLSLGSVSLGRDGARISTTAKTVVFDLWRDDLRVVRERT